MYQVLQVLEIFEICISVFSNFGGRQNFPVLVERNQRSMTAMTTIYVEIIDNFYIIVYTIKRWYVPEW